MDGRTSREVAHDLNKEGVSPPRGRAWNASTIGEAAEAIARQYGAPVVATVR